MAKESADYVYSYENIDYQNDDSGFNLTQEAIDFLSVVQAKDSDGNIVYYDKNGNVLSEEQYEELYQKFLASLDDDTREEIETFSDSAAGYDYSTGGSKENSIKINSNYLGKAITKIRDIQTTVKDSASRLKSLIAPSFLEGKSELAQAQMEARPAIGTGEALEADNFINNELKGLEKLQRQIQEEQVKNYNPANDLYKLYNLENINSGSSGVEIKEQAEEISKQIEQGIQNLLKMYAENNKDYDSEFLKETINNLNEINKSRKKVMEYYTDQAFWDAAQSYNISLTDPSNQISQEQLNYFNENKEKYDSEMNKLLDECEKRWNEAAKYGDFAKYGSVVNKYSLLTDEERYKLFIWSNINTNLCLHEIEINSYEDHIREYEELLDQMESSKSYSSNLVVSGYSENFMAENAQEKSDNQQEIKDKYESIKLICDSEAGKLEELRKQISYYTEIGLDITFLNIASIPSYKRKEQIEVLKNELEFLSGKNDEESKKRISVIESQLNDLNSKEDFLIQRQQFLCGKYSSEISNDILKYQEELDELNNRIELREKEIRTEVNEKTLGLNLEDMPSAFNISDEEWERIKNSPDFTGLADYVLLNNKEYQSLLSEKQALEYSILKCNDSIRRFNELSFFNYEQYSDYKNNKLNKISRIETGQCNVTDSYIKFYDESGNIIYPTEEEIAVYFAQSGEKFPSGQIIYYADENGNIYKEGNILSSNFKMYGSIDKRNVKRGIKCLNYTNDTDARLAILNYLDNVHGYSTFATNYQNQVTLGAQIEGKRRADKWLKSLENNHMAKGLQVSLKGFHDGLAQYVQGIGNFFGGADGFVSESDYAIMYYVSGLLEEYGGYGNLMEHIYEISSSMGNMIPTIISSTIVKFCPPAAFLEYVSLAAMGISSAGNTLESGLQSGLKYDEAFVISLMSGASEIFLDKLISGVLPTSKLKLWSSKSFGVWTAFLIDNFSETIEESLQVVLEPCFKYMSTGEWDGIDWKEVEKSGIYAAITAGLLNGGEIVVSKGVSVALTGNPNILNALVLMHNNDDASYNFFSKDFINELKVFKNSELAFDQVMMRLSSDPTIKSEYESYLSGIDKSLLGDALSFKNFVLMQTARQVLNYSKTNEKLVQFSKEIDSVLLQRDELLNQLEAITDINAQNEVFKQIQSKLEEYEGKLADLQKQFSDYFKKSFNIDENVVYETTAQIGETNGFKRATDLIELDENYIQEKVNILLGTDPEAENYNVYAKLNEGLYKVNNPDYSKAIIEKMINEGHIDTLKNLIKYDYSGEILNYLPTTLKVNFINNGDISSKILYNYLCTKNTETCDIMQVINDKAYNNLFNYIDQMNIYGYNYNNFNDIFNNAKDNPYSFERLCDQIIKRYGRNTGDITKISGEQMINDYLDYAISHNITIPPNHYISTIDKIILSNHAPIFRNGTININGKIYYSYNLFGSIIYSEIDLISVYLSLDSKSRTIIERDFLSMERVHKSADQRGGYVGYFIEDSLGQISKYRIDNVPRTFRELVAKQSNLNMQYFEKLRSYNNTNSFGVNQRIRDSLKEINPNTNYLSPQYVFARDFIMKKYNTTSDVVSFIYHSTDVKTGICSYADQCNKILLLYANKPEEFRRIFGYDIKTAQEGLLLMDLYLYTNISKNNGEIFKYNKYNGKLEVNYDTDGYQNYLKNFVPTKKERYPLNFEQWIASRNNYYAQYNNDTFLNGFLESVGSDERVESFYASYNDSTNLKSLIQSYLLGGYQVSLYEAFDPNNVITFYNLDGGPNTRTDNWEDDDAHITTVVGIEDDGVIVISWGHKHKILYKDLNTKNSKIFVSKYKGGN